MLNCTFELDVNEVVRNVFWRKKLQGTDYNSLADFSYKAAVYLEDGLSLETRSNLQSFDDISKSAILKITDFRCEDVGQYQCQVKFSVGSTAKSDQKGTPVYIKGISF